MSYVSRLVSIALVVAVLALAMPAIGQEQPTVERIYVLGAVTNAGDFEFKAGMDVKEAIDLAGGLAPHADPSGGTLVRATGEKVALNLKAIMAGTEKVALSPGDTIVVKPGTIRVMGEVLKPGEYDLSPGLTVLQAINLAGGPTPKGRLALAYVTRNGKPVPVDLQAYLKGKTEANPMLQAGDVISVPAEAETASITGEVVNPGSYPITLNTSTLEGLLEAAGGPGPKADLKNVRISSLRGNERDTRTVDASNKTTRQSTQIRSGDTIFIPQAESRRGHRISLSEIYQVTIIVYTLVQIFRH